MASSNGNINNNGRPSRHPLRVRLPATARMGVSETKLSNEAKRSIIESKQPTASQVMNGRLYCYHCNKAEPRGTVENHMTLYWNAAENKWNRLVDERLNPTPPDDYLPYVILGWRLDDRGRWQRPNIVNTRVSSSSHWQFEEEREYDDDDGGGGNGHNGMMDERDIQRRRGGWTGAAARPVPIDESPGVAPTAVHAQAVTSYKRKYEARGMLMIMTMIIK